MLTETILLEQNKRLRERNEELEEEVRQLREDAIMQSPFPDWVPHLTPTESDILRLLCRREVVNNNALCTVLRSGEVRTSNLLSVNILRLRRKLETHGIEIKNTWGRGYHLTDESKALLVPPQAIAA